MTVSNNIVICTCSEIFPIGNISFGKDTTAKYRLLIFFPRSDRGLLGRGSKSKNYTRSNLGIPNTHLRCQELTWEEKKKTCNGVVDQNLNCTFCSYLNTNESISKDMEYKVANFAFVGPVKLKIPRQRHGNYSLETDNTKRVCVWLVDSRLLWHQKF